jgi:NAD(P)-dependent dehydrogenase (short-subunit alcohol dehydrogenase family)
MFENKTVIVTGAAMGIGLGIAEEFAKNKANMVLADIDEVGVQNAAREIESVSGTRALAIKCDVSKKEEVDSLINSTLENFGKIDVLVNNAGIFPFKSFLEMTGEDWDKVLDVNLKGTFLCSQAAAKVMNEGSRIVNISSIASLVGFENLTHYCASKGGVNGFTRALALELAPKKINVNVVAPGAIQTPGASINEEKLGGIISQIPNGRIGTPEDIAHATLFLSSSGADYITGQVLVVDGGWTLR